MKSSKALLNSALAILEFSWSFTALRLHISYLVLALVALAIGLPLIVAISRVSSSDRPRPYYEAVSRFPTWAKILTGVAACFFVFSIALGYAVARLGSQIVEESQITQLPYLRTASVVPVPRGNSGIDISISPHQNRTILEYGFARFRVRNMTGKPVSMLVDGAYSSFEMRLPAAAQSDSRSIRYMSILANVDNFVTIRPHQSVQTEFDILRYLSKESKYLNVGTYTGQVFYCGDSIRDEFASRGLCAPGNVGLVAGPMVTFRIRTSGVKILL